ncbi:MAG: carbohydrate ABC transporter permease [Clostridia bacterium]|nr:carbohydrate ABC transporter permease [Clostridia bacterium]
MNKVLSAPKKGLFKNKNTSIKRGTSPFIIGLLVVFIIYTLSMAILFGWAVFASLKTEDGYLIEYLWPNNEFYFNNYINVFKHFTVDVNGQIKTVADMFVNTILYAGVNAFIQALVPCVVAYLVVRFPCKFSSLIYNIVLITMILPIVGAYPAEMSVLRGLGLYNQIWGTWIQKFNFQGMYFLVFYAMVKSMGKEYWEAAYIDGADQYTVLLKVIMPLLKNTIVLVVLLQFIGFWNDYQSQLLYIPSYPTLAYGIYYITNVKTDSDLVNTPMKLSAAIVFATPIIILFVIFRNKLMGNLTMGGVKE